MEVIIRHCGSTLSDTYLHLLNEAGTVILYNDDYSQANHCSSSLHSYLKTVLQTGTYYVVSEGYSQNGGIQTTIEGRVAYLWYAYDACGNRIERDAYDELYYNTHIQVINTESKVVFRQKIQAKETSINLSAYPTGMYLITIQSDEQIVTKKILKK
jgi:DNA-binding beta-propeller fold protein YncE